MLLLTDTINVLALAYLGDAVFEIYIRNMLIKRGICKVKNLQEEAIKYVSAKYQAQFLDELIKNNFLKVDELEIVKRARNHKSHSSKTTDIVTYKKSTGLECLIGSLYLNKKYDRINQIMEFLTNKK